MNKRDLRDAIAAHAVTGICARGEAPSATQASAAYSVADAMMKARDPDQDEMDWHVVAEAVSDAISNAEGHVDEKSIKRAFQRAGILLLKDGP